MISKKPIHILLVDDEQIKCEILKDHLVEVGNEVDLVTNPMEAEKLLETKSYDVIVTDIRMPGKDGITFLRDIKEKNPNQAIIVMTAFGTVQSAVDAMKLGAYDYLQKPFSGEELLLKLDRLAQYQVILKENTDLKKQLALAAREPRLIGSSPEIRKVLARIHAVADSDSTVLIEGESGTGKEVVAKMIHECSHRQAGPFVAVSCAALPEKLIESELFGYVKGAFSGSGKGSEGRFEAAQNGTLFLDDIDDVPSSVQIKFLRAIQERTIERVGSTESIPINVRIIAATKQNLKEMVSHGSFREDMYYRLSVVSIILPPLDHRKEDIPLLAIHFLEYYANRSGIATPTLSPEALDALYNHSWKGNVRELEHVIESLIALKKGPVISTDDLPLISDSQHNEKSLSVNLFGKQAIDFNEILVQAEEKMINWALQNADGNLAKAANILQIPRSTLQYRITKLPKRPSALPPVKEDPFANYI